MRFFSSAIKIAQMQSPELYMEAQRAASRLLLRVAQQHLVKNQAFKRRLENLRCRTKPKKLKQSIEELQDLVRFCMEDSDCSFFHTLYTRIVLARTQL